MLTIHSYRPGTEARCVMKACAIQDHRLQGFAGQYLKSFDPEAEGVVGEWTTDIAQARVFDTMLQLIDCWRQIRQRQPVRPWDGKPNRPLTAFSIEIVPAPPAVS